MGETTVQTEGANRAFRRGLMLYGSTAAIAAALMVADGGLSPALAQSIGPRISPTVAAQGDFVVPGATPSPFFQQRSGTLDIVEINRNAVLNWTPYDNANNTSYVNFLPKDTELRFVGNGETFTVINRIITADNGAGAYRPVAFQGKVSSYLSNDGPSFNGPQGGNVWFYSPGGILATSTAAFNVGSLLLSTSDFTNWESYSNYSAASFSGVVDPRATVTLLSGAQINLPQANSNFTIFSPSIDMGGTATVNGSVGYVSAEAGDVIFYSDGTSFTNIATEAAPGNFIRHTGLTTGPASTGTRDFSVYDPQTIEFLGGGNVGVLLSGSIGYAPATDAALMPNGSIRLSVGSVTADGGVTLLSYASLVAANSVDFRAGAGQTIGSGADVQGGYDLDIAAPSILFGANAGGEIDISGGVTLTGIGPASEISAIVGAASGQNPAGSVRVAGSLSLNGGRTAPFGGSSGSGGTASVAIAGGGLLSVGGDLYVGADAAPPSGFGNSQLPTTVSGGSATVAISGPASRLTVGGSIAVSASAYSFQGDCECFPPESGSARGGNATFSASGGTLSAGGLTVAASARANYNAFSTEPAGDLSAVGGTATIDLSGATANFHSITANADAYGAKGTQGQDGGQGTGGTASFTADSSTTLSLSLMTLGARGVGGEGGDPLEGTSAVGAGGAGKGGNVTVSLATNPGTLNYLELNAAGYGGNGGADIEADAANGGAGGMGQGGTMSLSLSGAGTAIAGISEGEINAAGIGGSGGDGSITYFGSQAGSGGDGGTGTGGVVDITVANGASLENSVFPFAQGEGGAGGRGGNATFTDFGIAQQGQGGTGGDGFGGKITEFADGGTISGNLTLDVGGAPGVGGLDGYDVDGNYTGQRSDGMTTGGSIALVTGAGNSLFDLGTTELRAFGNTAGNITIDDRSTDPAGGMRFGSLYIGATGANPADPVTTRISGLANTLTVDGNFAIDANAIAMQFAGGGGVTAGTVHLGAYSGGITLANSSGTGTATLRSLGGLYIYSNGTIDAGAGTLLRSVSELDLTSNSGSLLAAGLSSGGYSSLVARGDVRIGDATIGQYLDISAGLENFDSSIAFHPEATAQIDGSVTVGEFLSIRSGGVARFSGTSSVRADDFISVRTGDDIIVDAGASLVSDISPSVSATIYLNAGDINLGGFSGDLSDPILTPIASVVVRGSLDSNGHTIFLSGDAIDATGSTIVTGNLVADVTDVPAFGPLSSDGGLLTSGCHQGSICLGSVTASGSFSAGLDSSDLQSLRIGSLNFTGSGFEVRSAGDISLGTSGVASVLTASELIGLTSLAGNISLTDIGLSSPDLLLSAPGSLQGNGNLASASSIRLAIGGSISAGQIFTGGNIVRDPESSGPFVANGDFIVTSIETGGSSPLAIQAAGDIAIGLADPNGAAISLSGQRIQLAQTSADTGSIALSGTSVQFAALRATGAIAIVSTARNIFGSGPGSIEAAGTIGLDAKTELTTGALQAGGAITATAGASAALGMISTTSGTVAVTAGSALTVGNVFTANSAAGDDIRLTGETISTGALASGDNIALSARLPQMTTASDAYSARLGITADAGGSFKQLTAGTFIDISGGPISVLGAIAGTSLRLVTPTGNVSALAPLVAGTTATLSAQQALTFGALTAGGDISATAGTNLGFGSVQSTGGNVSLRGDASLTVSGPGSVTAAGSVGLGSFFAMSAGTVQAGGPVTVSAGSTATLGNITTALGGVSASAGSTLAVGNVQTASTAAADDIALSGTNGVVTGSLVSGDNITLSGPVTAAGDYTARLAITADKGGSFKALGAGTAINISGGPIALSGANAGTSLRLATSSGNLTSTGPLVAGTTADLSAQVAIAIGALTAGGNIAANAGNDLTFSSIRSTGGNVALTSQQNGITGSGPGSITAAGTIAFNANMALVAGTIQAGGAITGTAGSGNSVLGAVSATSGGVNLSSSGLLSVASVQTADTSATDDVVLAAAGGLSTGMLTSGDAIRLSGPVSASGNYTARRGVTATQGGTFKTVSAGTAIDISGGPIALTGATAGTSLRLASSGGNLSSTGPLVAGTTADLTAPGGGIAIGALTASGSVNASARDGLIFASVESGGGNVSLASQQSAITGSGPGSIAAAGTVGLSANTALVAGTVQAGGTITGTAGAGSSALGAVSTTLGSVNLSSGGTLSVASVQTANTSAVDDIVLSAGLGLATGALISGDAIRLLGPVIATGDYTSRLGLSASQGGIFRTVTAGTSIVISGGPISLTGASAGTSLRLAAMSGGVFASGPLSAGTTAILTAPDNIAIGALTAGGNVALNAGGTLTGTDWISGGSITLNGSGLALGNALGASGLSATIGGAATFASLASANGAVLLDAGGNVSGGDVSAGTALTMEGAAISVGNLTAGTGLSIDADSIEGDDLVAGSDLALTADGAALLQSAVAGATLSIASGSLTASTLVSGGSSSLTIAGLADLGAVVSGDRIDLAADSLIADNLDAAGVLDVAARGAGTIGAFSSGEEAAIVADSLALGTGSAAASLSVRSLAGDLFFDDLRAGGDAILDANSALLGGSLSAGGAMMLGAANLSVDSAGAGGDLTANIENDAVFASLSSSAGSAVLNSGGAVTGGDIAAAADARIAGGAATLGTVNAGNAIRLDVASLDASMLVAGSTLDIAATGAVGFASAKAGTDMSIVAETVEAGSARAGGTLSASAEGALRLAEADAVGDMMLGGESIDVASATSGGALAAVANGSVKFGSVNASSNLRIEGSSIDAGTARAGGVLFALSDGSVRFGSADADGDLTLDGGTIDIDRANSGGTLVALGDGSVRLGEGTSAGNLTVEGADLDLGDLSAGGGLFVTGDGSVKITSGAALAGLSLKARDLDADTLAAGGAADLTVDGVATIDMLTAGSLDLKARDLTANRLASDSAMAITVENVASVASARSGGALTLRAGTLAAGSLSGKAGLDVATIGSASVDRFTAPAGAVFNGASLDLGNGEVVGTLSATTTDGDLAFGNLDVSGAIDLAAARALVGGNAFASGQFMLRGASVAVGDIEGGLGIAATTPGDFSFGVASSGAGNISGDAGGAVSGSAANAAGGITFAGSSVALGSASFDNGLRLTARATDLTGSGLYSGSGAVALKAAHDIAVGSVDTLGAITLDAARDAGFAELRSRDGNVSARSAGKLTGSTVAATGGDPAGEDHVTLVAGGDVTLTGTITALNSASFAQDDFSAQAGGTLTVASVAAGRDLALSSGAGSLGAADISSGRDLSLTAPTVRVDEASVAGNLTVIATAGDITGSGTTSAAGAITLRSAGGIAVGNLAANGGGIAAEAGTGIAFGNLSAAGPVVLDAATGITGSGDIASGGGVSLVTEGGGTSLRDIRAAGPVSLQGRGALDLRDVTQSAGSLTVSYDGEIVLRNAKSAAAATIEGGAGIAFSSVEAATNLGIRAVGAVAGGTLSAGQSAQVDAGGAIGLAGLSAANGRLAATGGAIDASGLAVAGVLEASGSAVTLAAPGALRLRARATAGALSVTTGGDLTIDGQATGAITLASTGGSVLIGTVGQQELSGSGIGTQALGGGAAIAIDAANGISVADSLVAAGALTMNAGGLVTLDGATTGQTIALRSGDLAIGANGTLGTGSTQRVSLASTNAINLGDGASGGFAVNADEFARIASGGDLLVSALAGTGTSAGSITVGALTVNAGNGGQIGSSGTFGLTANGVLDVNNTLSIGRAGAGNTLMLTGDAVDLDYANAALSVLDSANAATGRIIVNGRLITSLSASAAADIVGKTPAEISPRLGQSDVTRSIGLFRAGTLILEGRDAILIQNSGGTAVDDRRGLTVGSLTVTGKADGTTLVVINGVIGNSTGNNAAQNVTLTNPIAPGSSFNGCVLANAAACLVSPAPPPVPEPIFAPTSIVNGTSDLIRQEEDEDDDEVKDGVADGKNDAPPIDTRFIDDPAGRPMLDDPVTGAGNEDLWQPPEE